MLTRIGILVLVTVWLGAVLPAAGETMEGVRGPISAEEIGDLVDGAPAEADLPGEDAVVLFDGTYIEYAGGLATMRRQRLVKVFTEWAIDHIGDPRLAFDGSRQELTVHASRTYLLDGSTVDTPDNGYNEVTPSSVALSRDHLSIREMVVTHVGLERGVSVLLDYSVTDTSPLEFPFNRMFFLQDEFPALEKVIVMEGDLQGEVVNPLVGLFDYAQPEQDGDKLTWSMKDLPARPMHQDQRLGDQVPWLAVASARIGLSSMQAWPALLMGLGEEVDRAAENAGELAGMIESLDEESPFLTDRDALERMAEMITEHTVLLRYRPWVFTPLPRSVSGCLETSTATPIERCALILACCRARGLEANMVVPARWGSLSEKAPALEALADPLVRVADSNGLTYWIDPGTGSLVRINQIPIGITAFIVGPEGVEPSTPGGWVHSIGLSVFWDLEEGKARVKGVLGGSLVGALEWDEPEKLIRGWAESWCDSAEVTDLSIESLRSDGIKFSVELDAPLPTADERDRTVVELPFAPIEMGELIPEGMDLSMSQADGIFFPSAQVDAHVKWLIRLPRGFDLLPGPSVSLAWEDGAFELSRKDRPAFVDVTYDLTLGGKPILPDEYSGYRSLFLEATDSRHARLVFVEEEEEE